MIDTIRVEIRASDFALWSVQRFLQTHEKIDNQSGEVLRSFVQGSLKGSWDSRISCKIKDHRWVSKVVDKPSIFLAQKNKFGPPKLHEFKKQGSIPVCMSCPPFIEIEFSLAKWADSVNFLNCSMFQDMVRLSVFRIWFQGLIGALLPPIESWIVHRVDMAINYFIGSNDQVLRMIDCYKNLTYSRRKPIIYKTSVYFPGSTTTVKLYCKGPEFRAHEKGNFRKKDDKTLFEQLCFLADGILRFEIEFHSRKLDDLGLVYLDEVLNYSAWGDMMKKELDRILIGAKTTKVYTMREVRSILNERKEELKGSHVTADSVYAIWLSLSLSGKTESNKIYGYKKVQRATKVLEQLGIACVANITEAEPPKVPDIDFMHYDSEDYDKILRKKVHELLDYDDTPIHAFYDSFPLPPRKILQFLSEFGQEKTSNGHVN